MLKKIVFSIFILFLSFSLIAQPAQKLWSVDCSLFSKINKMYKLASLAPPSSAGPWTTNELRQMVAFVNDNKPLESEEFVNLSNLVQEELNKESRFLVTEEVKINTSLEYNFESYAHSNTSDFTEEEDWNYDWIKRAPIIKIPVQISFSDTFASEVDIVAMQKLLDYKTNPVGKYSKAFWTNNNLPDFFFLDLLWPYHASGVAGGDFWKFQIGRERLSWGPGHTGNFMITNHLPFHDHLLLSLFSNKLKYTTTIIDFPSPEERGTGNDSLSMLFAHRIEFTLFSKMRVSLSESMMYQNDVLNLRYLNPLMIYHQYFIADKSNSLLTLELQLNPIKNFTFYGQFCMDEMQILGESSSIPNAMGYQIGMEVQKSNFLFWGEYTYTDPMLYQRNGIDYIVSYRAMYADSGSEYILNYLGYPLGGDALVYAAGIDFDYKEQAKAKISFQHITKGETLFNATYPPSDPSVTSPTGTPETTMILSLTGSYNFKKPSLTIYSNLSFLSIENKNHIISTKVKDSQFTFGLRYTL